ncbi:MAG TPA: tetratricopeptide repeat protein [Candidatus Limnocylindria bacterium]|nr:tetratricopeptide repeat protein [Candidatus Limnocylindria bacterium]
MDRASANQTQTFLFTDIEGSTRLLEALGDGYRRLLERQRELITAAVTDAGGRVFGSEGDALFAVFGSAGAALAAAARAQRELAAERWPSDEPLRVRMGIHSGEVVARDDDFVGLPLHQVARITAAGHGGQTLVSEATRSLAGLPAGLELRDLGEHRLKDLAAPVRLYQLVGDGLADGFPPLRTLQTRPGNLPAQLTSFVGREELAAAADALQATRLLTLTGPGGTGKTRMSLQLAEAASDAYPDGVFFVALDAIRDPELVASAITSALGLNVPGATRPLDALIEHLRDRQVLLVLDNFEQVVGAGPDIGRLLREAAGLKVIVTSRIVLHVNGEREFPVPPLARSEGLHLFVERARAVRSDFGLTDDSARLVEEIVRRLDGLPLAIELAAARLRILPLEQISARLDHKLGLLTGGARDMPGRQQTLRGAIDWSYELLDDGLRRLFGRLSVFRGGAGLEQIEAVCGPAAEIGRDVLDGLADLADQSLIRPVDGGRSARFAMLETIREYGLEKLAESGEMAGIELRHARAYLQLAERIAPGLHGADQLALLDELDLEQGNLRAALDACGIVACADEAACRCAADEHAGDDERVEISLRLVAALWRFWQKRGYLIEGRSRAERTLSLPRAAAHGRAYLRALEATGGLTYWIGDLEATERLYTDRLELARQTGEPTEVAAALYDLSFVTIVPGTASQVGAEMLSEAINLYEAAGDEAGIARAKWAMATHLFNIEDWPKARETLEEIVAVFRRLDSTYDLGWGLHSLGVAEIRLGRPDDARRAFEEGLGIFAAVNDLSGIVLFLGDYAELAAAEGDQDRALRLFAASKALAERTGSRLADAMREGNLPFVLELRTLLESVPAETVAARAAEGSALSLAAAIAYALGSDEPSFASSSSAAELMQ